MKRALFLFMCATLACGSGAMAQPYPNRPITLIVPYGAGGPHWLAVAPAKHGPFRLRTAAVSLGAPHFQTPSIKMPENASEGSCGS